MQYEKHELNSIVPVMNDAEFEDLKQSIKDKGFMSCFGSVLLFENKIIDGWSRYTACQAVGVDPVVEHFTGTRSDAIDLISKSITRRHMSDFSKYETLQKLREELAAIARERKLSGLKQFDSDTVVSKTDTTDEPADNGRVRRDIADRLGWSSGKTARADYVNNHAPEEIKEQQGGE